MEWSADVPSAGATAVTKVSRIIVVVIIAVFLTGLPAHARSSSYDELDYIGAFGTGPLFDIDTTSVKIIFHGPRDSMKVALAFDDGPFGFTNDILDILAAHDVKATFFIVGIQVEKFPEIARRIVDEGHQVGNHTYSHKLLTKVGKATWTSQIDQASVVIYDATGVHPVIFRPPYRGYDNEIMDYVNEAGMTLVLWDVDPYDWKTSSASLVEKRIMKAVQPGSILTLHDLSAGTRKGLDSIIVSLKERGYELVTVGEMIEDYLREEMEEEILAEG